MIDVRTTPAPIETVTPIKPSEAIRLGCIVSPVQNFGMTHNSVTGASCAIGAMELGAGVQDDYEALARLRDMTPETCPLNPEHRYSDNGDGVGWSQFAGPTAIAHLNDDHRWSRERIADWLEGLGL